MKRLVILPQRTSYFREPERTYHSQCRHEYQVDLQVSVRVDYPTTDSITKYHIREVISLYSYPIQMKLRIRDCFGSSRLQSLMLDVLEMPGI
jgi:hypothetical protein